MSPWLITRLRLYDIEEFSDVGCHYRPIRHRLGITAFGVTAWTARAVGDVVINEHDADDPTADQELFLVLRGRAVFELNDDRVDAPAGTLVFAPPRTKRTAFATQEGTTIIAVEGTPGKAYEARGWELWAPLEWSAVFEAAAKADLYRPLDLAAYLLFESGQVKCSRPVAIAGVGIARRAHMGTRSPRLPQGSSCQHRRPGGGRGHDSPPAWPSSVPRAASPHQSVVATASRSALSSRASEEAGLRPDTCLIA